MAPRHRGLTALTVVAIVVSALVPLGAGRVAADSEAPATVSGVVTDARTGAPVAGAWVTLLRAYDHQPAAEVVAGADGAFSASLPAGSYNTYLIDPTGAHQAGFAGAPELVRLRSGEAVTVAAEMVAATGALSGRVTDATSGESLSGVWVLALGASGAPEAAVRSDGSGRYAFAALVAGPHRLAFLDPTATHATEYWEDSSDILGSSVIDIRAADEAVADAALTRQSASLALTSLRGTITESGAGTALPDVLVLALRTSDLRLAGAAQTSATGRYRVNVPLGTYRLAFVDPSGAHAMEWHADRPFDQPAAAAPVSAPAVVNAALTPTTGDVRGAVHDAESGAAVGGSWVMVIDAAGRLRGAITAADGSFHITGLPTGTYRAAILDTAGDRRLEYWDDEADFSGADTFTVTPDTPAVVHAELDARAADGSLRSESIGWWQPSAGLDGEGTLADLSGTGNDMVLHAGGLVPDGPAVLAPDPVRGRNLFSPGWDDMFLETPAPAEPPAGIDVAWEADLARVLTIDQGQPVNWIVHQGSTATGTFSWAVGVEAGTGRVVVAHSADGVEVTTVGTDAVVAEGSGRMAVTLDPATGTVQVHQQPFEAAVEAFDAPYDEWETAATVPGDGPVELFPSPAPIRHSSTVEPDVIDGQWLVGWFRSLYRLRVRAGVEGAVLASLDVATLPDELVWARVGGLPPVGGVTTASVAGLTGRVGETWTITNYDTTSYPMALVEHPMVLFGNGSYGELPLDDWAFDASAVGDLSVWIVYRDLRPGVHYLPLVAHRGRAWSAPGYAITQVPNTSSAPLAHVSDGARAARSVPPTPSQGATNLVGLQIDADAPYDLGGDRPVVVASTNGIAGPAEGLDLLGPITAPDTPLRVGTWSDDAAVAEGFGFIGLALFDRTLTEAEVERLAAEFGIG